MLRLSPLLLVLAASGAIAQEAPAQPTAAATTSPAPAAAVTTTAPTPATPPPAVNARLTPGGIIENTESKFPLGIQANLSNSVGNGVLAPGFQAQPQWSSSLSLSPSVRIPKIEGLPTMRLGGGISFSMSNWLMSFSDGGVYARQLRVSDASLRLSLPQLYTEEFTGISASVSVGATAPISIGSRQQNVVTSLSASVPLGWNTDTSIGNFSVGYSPSVRGTLYSQVAATMACDDFQEYGTPRPLGDPVNSTEDLPTFIPAREVQVLENGDCALPGRQRLFSISQGLSGSWTSTDNTHSLSLSLGWNHSFLRPLTNHPELSSINSSGQNFNESTSGSIGYSYSVPVDFPLQLSLSAGSEQGVFTILEDGSQVPTFPFWDFLRPANNASGVSFDVTIGI